MDDAEMTLDQACALNRGLVEQLQSSPLDELEAVGWFLPDLMLGQCLAAWGDRLSPHGTWFETSESAWRATGLPAQTLLEYIIMGCNTPQDALERYRAGIPPSMNLRPGVEQLRMLKAMANIALNRPASPEQPS